MKKQLKGCIFLLVFSLSCMACLSQTDTLVYYLDEHGAVSNKQKAAFIVKGINKDERFLLSYYVLQTGKLFRKINYLDSTLSIKDGPYAEYDADGKTVLTNGVYREDLEDGQWIYWDQGYLTDSVLYDKAVDLIHISYTYHFNNKVHTRQFIDTRDKIKEIVGYYNSGELESRGKWMNGTGEQVYYYPTSEIKVVEKYKNDRMTSTKYFKPDGTQVSEKQQSLYEEGQKNSSRPMLSSGSPEYPGGSAGFQSFFRRNFKPPPSLGAQGFTETITVTFSLDKSGFATDIKVSGGSNRDIEIEVITVFRRMPAWNMHGWPGFGPITYTLSL